MYHFHVNLFAAPNASPFPCTWEDAATLLQRLPRMIFEPDGSFMISGEVERAGPSSAPSVRGDSASVLGGGDAPARWQVDGHLFDFAGRLHRMELHGTCPPEAFDTLLRCVGWPTQRLAFEMVREGVTVDEATFRAQAAL